MWFPSSIDSILVCLVVPLCCLSASLVTRCWSARGVFGCVFHHSKDCLQLSV
jgi:hypothetical protein